MNDDPIESTDKAGDLVLRHRLSTRIWHWTNALAVRNPAPYTPAGTNANTGLDGDATRRANAAAAGLPVNYFRANPDLMGGANLTTNTGLTRYDSMQVELAKRLSHGVQFQGSYVYGQQYESVRTSFSTPRVKRFDVGTPGNVTHAFKATWVLEMPFADAWRMLRDKEIADATTVMLLLFLARELAV